MFVSSLDGEGDYFANWFTHSVLPQRFRERVSLVSLFNSFLDKRADYEGALFLYLLMDLVSLQQQAPAQEPVQEPISSFSSSKKMEKNNDPLKESQTQPSDTGCGNPDTSNPPDSSTTDSSSPPPPYVQPISIPISPRPRTSTQCSPLVTSLPFRPHPRTVTSSSRQARPEETTVSLQQESVPGVIVQRGFGTLIHRPPTPKPAYAEFGGRWCCKDENNDSRDTGREEGGPREATEHDGNENSE